MATPKEELLTAIQEKGVTRSEAEQAIKRCVMATAKQGAATYAGGGLLLYFLSMPPSALAYGTVAFGAGATHPLSKSPSCNKVRIAIQFYNRASF
jgi:hypothetical protein